MTAYKLKGTVNEIARAYYKKYRRYGDLTIGYDAPRIFDLVAGDLAAQGREPDARQLSTTIEGNIISGAYKLNTDDKVLIYLFFAAVIIWVYFHYKNKTGK